jgi:hypothetical protein
MDVCSVLFFGTRVVPSREIVLKQGSIHDFNKNRYSIWPPEMDLPNAIQAYGGVAPNPI